MTYRVHCPCVSIHLNLVTWPQINMMVHFQLNVNKFKLKVLHLLWQVMMSFTNFPIMYTNLPTVLKMSHILARVWHGYICLYTPKIQIFHRNWEEWKCTQKNTREGHSYKLLSLFENIGHHGLQKRTRWLFKHQSRSCLIHIRSSSKN
jgi:hypothetical protein